MTSMSTQVDGHPRTALRMGSHERKREVDTECQRGWECADVSPSPGAQAHMVLFFTPRGGDAVLFMGRDKYENEDLIKWGVPEDIWFHVDDMSSAHVYLRLPRGRTIRDISKEELEDASQLCKANSIQGSKSASVAVVYTPWANLKKTPDMDVGQVGFHDEKAVLRVGVPAKNNELLNRLNKTKEERFPNLAQEREAYDAAVRSERRAAERARRKEEEQAQRARQAEAEARSYDRIMDSAKMVANSEVAAKYASVQEAEEDFM